jgi:tripartite-type tricarboxylate transporter receptor subunit TctC
MLLGEALDPAQTHFESLKFGWIGTIATTTDILAVFKSTGVDELQAAKQQEIRIGGADLYSLSTLEPAAANAMLGTKFRVIMGYGGGDAMDLAMERHEIDGRTNQWASWKVLRPDWISQNLLSYLLQFGPKDSSLPSTVPTLSELVKTPEETAIVNLLEIPQYMGRSVFAPPGIPAEQLKTLQQAFDETMHDPAFVNRMRELNLELYPHKPDEFQEALRRTMQERENTVRNMKAMLKLN